MNTKNQPRRRSLARAALLALVAMILIGNYASPASAVTWNSSGSVGSVTLPTTVGYYYAYNPTITVGARNAKESPAYAGYAQKICFTSKLWRIVPTPNAKGYPYWALTDSNSRCGTITAAQTSINDGGNVFPSSNIIPGRGYSVTVDVSWQLTNGTVIGRMNLDYDLAADYSCTSANCYVGNTQWGGGAFIAFPNM